ncbi:hypothetical protein [Aeromonas sp.]|uniref:hypothetical protein n=1 Tax=Aeromonas sp. TaxID=647 RepID=UPI00258898E5|nr:hypothetical protein [Aeromonas sp.]MCX7132120.1 hypothetical protein [Aeromonas sp.]
MQKIIYGEALTHKRKNELSIITDSTFYIIKESNALFLYGESLNLWLSIGGIVKGDVEIVRENNKLYCRAVISPSVFFGFIYNETNVFDVTPVCFGYKIKLNGSGSHSTPLDDTYRHVH